MRKLKLQMQMTIDGFVAGPNGELDWMEWNWSDDIKKYVNHLHDTVDTILLGRKMTDGFITHWSSVVEKREEASKELKENFEFAKKMIDLSKSCFYKNIENTHLDKYNSCKRRFDSRSNETKEKRW